MLLQVTLAGEVEYPLSVDVAQTGQSVAQRPALSQCCPESVDFTLCIFELSDGFWNGVKLLLTNARGCFSIMWPFRNVWSRYQ